MKFAIITDAVHKEKSKKIYAYDPYVREINLWLKFVDEVSIVAPCLKKGINSIESNYNHKDIILHSIPFINALSFKNKIISLFKLPIIFFKIFEIMFWADHIHLRCPGNIGLLGSIVQIFFPFKPKTVKYAGNWDPNSKQPISYRIQKRILSNTFLTKKCKVLVYGKWESQSKNIIPFFTASYTKKEIQEISNKNFSDIIKFIFVGTFSKGKQPLLCVKTIQSLYNKGFKVQLNMFGNGIEFSKVKNYIEENKLIDVVKLHGNQPKDVIKTSYQYSHFLIFISKSEGWPKVVAESMFWKCLPISSNVSCVSDMLGYGERGSVLDYNSEIDIIEKEIISYIKNEELYQQKILKAQKWSHNYTLDSFEDAIKTML